MPAFPTSFTQPHPSSYVASSQLSSPLPARSSGHRHPSPLPLTPAGFERPASDSTHTEVNLQGAEPKPLTDLVSLGMRKGMHNMLLPGFSATSKLYVQTQLKKKMKRDYQVPQKISKSYPQWTFNLIYA